MRSVKVTRREDLKSFSITIDPTPEVIINTSHTRFKDTGSEKLYFNEHSSCENTAHRNLQCAICVLFLPT